MSASSEIASECGQCQQSVAAANALVRAMACNPQGVSLIVQMVDDDGKKFGEPFRAAYVQIHCNACGDRRLVLTPDGRRFMDFIKAILSDELEREEK